MSTSTATAIPGSSPGGISRRGEALVTQSAPSRWADDGPVGQEVAVGQSPETPLFYRRVTKSSLGGGVSSSFPLSMAESEILENRPILCTKSWRTSIFPL